VPKEQLEMGNTPRQEFGSWPLVATLSWIGVAFLIAATSAFIVFLIFGAGARGTGIALRITARWSFLIFLLAYSGTAIAALFGSRFSTLARQSRDFGLAFASAQLIHVGLVVWIIHLSPKSNGGMIFFWVGILCTYLLALLSLPQLCNVLSPTLWKVLRTAAMEYIAVAFAADLIIGPLQRTGLSTLILPSYLPFALFLVGAMALRVTVNIRRRVTSRQPLIASPRERTGDQSAT
jgi:hypothetical protein